MHPKIAGEFKRVVSLRRTMAEHSCGADRITGWTNVTRGSPEDQDQVTLDPAAYVSHVTKLVRMLESDEHHWDDWSREWEAYVAGDTKWTPTNPVLFPYAVYTQDAVFYFIEDLSEWRKISLEPGMRAAQRPRASR